MASGYFGLYTAEVADNQDPNGHGRMRIRAPQILDAEESIWAKPLLPFGHFFLPEVGDLAWLLFEGGELDNPVWLGAQITRGHWTDTAPDGDPTVRTLQSRAGHVVTMRDTAGSETLEIFSPTRLVIRSTGAITINAPIVTINDRPVAPLPSSFTL